MGSKISALIHSYLKSSVQMSHYIVVLDSSTRLEPKFVFGSKCLKFIKNIGCFDDLGNLLTVSWAKK